MQHASRKNVLVLAVVALLAAQSTSEAFRGGPPAGRTGSIASGGSDCTQCHSGTPGPGSVQILGAPSSYELNQSYDLTVRISDMNQDGAGFQISVEDSGGVHVGSLTVTDAINTQVNSNDANFINHTSIGVNNSVSNWAGLGNAAEYTVRWQAPAADAGPITIWAAGNAINDNGSSSGDKVYLTNQTISLAETVPTVSEWGLFVLALVVMSAGTVLLRKYPLTA